MRKILLLLLFMFLSLKAFALQWSQMPGHVSGRTQDMLAHPTNPAKLYLATEKQLYQSEKKGGWKRLFSVSGSHRIHAIYISPQYPDCLYVASSKGLYCSKDSGVKWEFLSLGAREKDVLSVSYDEEGRLWAGTSTGIFMRDHHQNEWFAETSVPNVPIHQMISIPETRKLVILTSQGIYVGEKGIFSLALPGLRREEGSESEGMSEEEFSEENLYSLARVENKLYALMDESLWISEDFGRVWTRFSQLPDSRGSKLESSNNKLYLLTSLDAYQWDSGVRRFVSISEGLPDKKIQDITFSRSGQYLVAATKKGIYKSPAFDLYASPANEQGVALSHNNLLRQFEAEPTITEIQNVAIQYAEVHPDKITQWRKQAAKRAWLPSVGISRDLGSDNNIDLDRGGTADQDKFIEGPADKSSDWSFDVSWDLADLIWNNDQTSIDARSRLVVELREDILNQITHLYFERRRLQVEMLLTPYKEMDLQVEKELKLQELTAQIDALCGGYLSRKLLVNRSNI